MGRKDKDLEGQGLKVSRQQHVSPGVSALSSFYHLLIHGSAEVVPLVAHQTHFHTALKKERTSLTISDRHSQGINFAASGVDFTVGAEFGCKLGGTSIFVQREYNFRQVYIYLETQSDSVSPYLAVLLLLPDDLK